MRLTDCPTDQSPSPRTAAVAASNLKCLRGDAYTVAVAVTSIRLQKTLDGEPRTFNPGRDYLRPIPAREPTLNPNLTQNPGY